MKEHYYSNFKGCLGTRTHLDSLDGSLASILAPPSIHILSLFLSLSLLFHVTLPLSVVAHQNRLNFELAYFYLVVTLSPRRGRRSTVENIPPSSLHNAPDIANYFAFILPPPPLSLSFSAPKFKFASRRSQKGVHLVRARNEGGGERSRRISGALVA